MNDAGHRSRPRGGPPGDGRRDRRAARVAAAADPRRIAFDVLKAVEDEHAYANLLLPRLLTRARLSARDAGLATDLTYRVLRGRGTYDAVLAACVDRPLAQVDPDVLQVLRLGAHQILASTVPAHAAVATSVDLARAAVGPGVAGFVNAVLRRLTRDDLPGWMRRVAPDPAKDLYGHLSVTQSHPRWIVETLAAALTAWDRDVGRELPALLAAHNAPPAVTLVARPGRSDVAELIAGGARPGRWSPRAAVLGGGDPHLIPAVAQGRAGIQDEGSQLVALALARAGRLTRPVPSPTGSPPVGGVGDPSSATVGSAAWASAGWSAGSSAGSSAGDDEGTVRRFDRESDARPRTGQMWLDLCAGPGGKAALLAGLGAAQGARLLGCEIHPHRAALLAEALKGSGETSAVVVADSTRPAWSAASFDLVLADVPCSGLGSLRRRPEARWRRTPEDAVALHPRQAALLGCALDAARPGGVVGYATCSPWIAETIEVVRDVLASHRDVEVLDARRFLPGVSDLGPGPYVQLWPHLHATDAMFLALLRRR